MKSKESLVRKKIRRMYELRKEGMGWWELFLRFLLFLGIYRPNDGRRNVLREWFVISICRAKNFFVTMGKGINNDIIIIETGVLGDCILVIDAFKKVQKYCQDNNMKLTVVCGKTMARLFSDNADLNEIKYICYKNRDEVSIGELKELAAELRGTKYNWLLMRDSNPLGFRIAGLVRASKSMYYSYDVDRRNKVDLLMAKKYFKDVRNFDDNIFIPNIWKEMLKNIGINDYQPKIAKIHDKENVDKAWLPSKEYILVCPEGSNTNKNFTISQCENIIDYLNEKYSYDVVFCTNARDENYTIKLEKMLSEKKVVSYINRTNFGQFVTLVANARMMIGCDSGSIHLAAALEIEGIYLGGYWDESYFLPYNYEDENSRKMSPRGVYVRKKPECMYCGVLSDKVELEKYKKCRTQIEKGLPFDCISEILFDDVRMEIDNFLKE